MPKRKPVQVDVETHGVLTSFSQEYGIKIGDVVAYLARTAKTYNMFDADWVDKLTSVVIDEFKKSFDEKLQINLEKERVKSIQRITHTMVSKYLDALSPEERKRTIEGMLGDLKTGNVLERLAEMELVTIDGKKRLVKMKDGKPDIHADPDKLVQCEIGWHNVGYFCKCNRWRECDIRSMEYEDYKIRTDPQYRDVYQKPRYRR